MPTRVSIHGCVEPEYDAFHAAEECSMSSYIKPSTLEKAILKQVKVWEKAKKIIEKSEVPRPFITISREYGCGASEVAAALAEELNKHEGTDAWQAYDKEVLNKIIENHNVSEKLLETIDTRRRE
jgi:hypothetical protein